MGIFLPFGKAEGNEALKAVKVRKTLDFKEIQGFGEDERDRTADLLHAILRC